MKNTVKARVTYLHVVLHAYVIYMCMHTHRTFDIILSGNVAPL